MRAVVLGIGNTLLTDEAAGVRAVEALEQAYSLPANVQIIDGGTSGMELIEDLSHLDLLIVIDVVKTGAAQERSSRSPVKESPFFFAASYRHTRSPCRMFWPASNCSTPCRKKSLCWVLSPSPSNWVWR
jgi:hydrogenase maturation protease